MGRGPARRVDESTTSASTLQKPDDRGRSTCSKLHHPLEARQHAREIHHDSEYLSGRLPEQLRPGTEADQVTSSRA
eukprot:5372258-Pyramimonas_sp.AAC.1